MLGGYIFVIILNNKLMENTVKQRLIDYIEYKKINKNRFETEAGLSKRYVSNIEKSIQPDKIKKISIAFPDLNTGWLLTGEGEMLKDNKKSDISDISSERKNLIPFYDNVATVGGRLNMSADVDTPHSVPTEYIDTGDWFREATAAIRHYEDSMDEYPSGCILALKEVKDRRLVVPGRDYVIETDEYRVTKRVQLGKDDEHIIAYSTNKETYPDGKLVHEPFPIPKKAIRNISLVLGYVVKKNGGTMVYNTNSKR